jgi:hypothetical protein
MVRAKLPVYQYVTGSEIKSIKLQWPFRASAANIPVLLVQCQEFRPNKEVLVEEYLANGVLHEVPLPPWACCDVVTGRKAVQSFMDACQGLLEDEIRETLSDPIMLCMWDEVKRYQSRHSAPLLTQALRIYAGAMMNSKYPTPVEEDVFGVATRKHTAYFFEKVPLPPQLTLQIQTLVGHMMLDIQKQVLKQLKACIFSKDRIRHWYEVLLVVFVLLATIEWVYQTQIRFLQTKQGVNERNFTNISYVTQYMLDEWEASAFNLIGHFRCVMSGDVPFLQSWEDGADNPRRTGLDMEALAFIRNIQRLASERKDDLRQMRQLKGKVRFAKPLSAICELFLPQDD